MYWIKFFVTERGECPFQLFLDAAEPRVKAKFIKILDLLAHQGPDLKRPYADILRDGIRELRVRFGTNRYRAFYFFFCRDRIIVTHGILKNTDTVPPAEIDRASRYKTNFETRLEKGEIVL